MSFLQEMGIQEWRLRGRRPIAAEIAADDSSLRRPNADTSSNAPKPLSNGDVPDLNSLGAEASINSPSENQPSIAPLESTSGAPAGGLSAIFSSKESAPNKDELIKSASQNAVTKDQAVAVDSSEGLETNKQTSKESLNETPGSDASKISPSVSGDLTSNTASNNTANNAKGHTTDSNVVMPTLRPAPVPIEVPVAIDLSMDEPQNGLESEAVPEMLSQEPMMAPAGLDEFGYSDADIERAGLEAGIEGLDDLSSFEPAPNPTVNSLEAAANIAVTPDATSVAAIGSGELSELDWRALQARISGDHACQSCGQQQSVLGYGDVLADWMFIADAPTSVELQEQQLFVGRAGQLYEGILRACGLGREDVYSTTIFKCSPPEDLSLSPQCDKLVHRQIELVKPKVIITFGEFASQSVLRSNDSFDLLRKGRHTYSGMPTFVIPSDSPQKLLADPALKAELWQGLKFAMQSIL